MKFCKIDQLPVFQTLIFSGLMIVNATAQSDPPGRVARLNLATGMVSMLTQSAGPDWIPAQINYPLTSGDQLWTDSDGRAEFHVGSTAVRLHEQTSAFFSLLDDRVLQLQLASGGVNINVRNIYDQEVVEIDTPNVSFTIRQPGEYRIDVSGEQTKVIVWSGAAEISSTDGRVMPLRARDFALVSGYGQLSYNLNSAPGYDEFDRWSLARDQRQQQSQYARYVSADLIGAEDLDSYGSWTQSANFGTVWVPRVDQSWAPYKAGHWAWIDPWGWTWIDDAAWGFAPFHYGRWAYAENSWVWVPGPRAQRAVYSPALVAWCGDGGGGGDGFRISASVGAGLAWFALGPGEVYIPAYHASAAYVNRMNVNNTVVSSAVVTSVYNTTVVNRTVVSNVTYVNRMAPGAVVGMSHADMAAGRRSIVVVAPAIVRNIQVSAMAPVPAARPIFRPVQQRAGGMTAIARPPAAVAAPSHPVIRRIPLPAVAARPAFTSATGVRAPERIPQASAPPNEPARRVEAERPAPILRPSERPQVAAPVQPERPINVAPAPAPPNRPEHPEMIRRPAPAANPAPAAAPPQQVRPAIERPQPRPERPVTVAPQPTAPVHPEVKTEPRPQKPQDKKKPEEKKAEEKKQ